MVPMSFSAGLAVVFVLGALALAVRLLLRQQRRADEAEQWPETEATIQSVGKVVVGRGGALDVADFSYKVNEEYYSGRVIVSRSSSSRDGSPRDLIDRKIQVRYDPRKPEKCSVPSTEVGGFLLSSYNLEYLATDAGPIDLNLDKI
jgi:hypothetical protein